MKKGKSAKVNLFIRYELIKIVFHSLFQPCIYAILFFGFVLKGSDLQEKNMRCANIYIVKPKKNYMVDVFEGYVSL
jgi:hypothetical protein